MEHDDGNKFCRQKFRMYTKWWTAATFLLTRIYLCVNNGHNNNFNPVLIIFRYILITFINIIHYKCIVLLSILSPSVYLFISELLKNVLGQHFTRRVALSTNGSYISDWFRCDIQRCAQVNLGLIL